MLPRFLTNLALLVIVVALGLLIVLSNDDNVVDTRLTKIDAQSVTRIDIHHHQRVIQLAKAGEHWQMSRPITVDANDFRIGTLLGLLSTTSHAAYDSAPLSLADYGLDAPETMIRFNDTEVDFGIENPVTHKRYVLVNNRVHLIDDTYYPLLSSQTGTLVSPSLLPRDTVITRIELPGLTLLKTDAGWQSTNSSLSADAITETVDHWKNDQAFGVHNYNSRESLGHIEVSVKGRDKPLMFEIIDTEPWLIIARPDIDIEYHFNLEYYDRLLQPGTTHGTPEEFEQVAPAPLHPL